MPVFYYALDQWNSAPHRVTVSSAAGAKSWERAAERSHANLVPLVAKGSAGRVRINYPEGGPAWWDAPANKPGGPSLAVLIDSPLRRTVAKHLASGEAAVWVLLQSGDVARDKAAEKMLTGRLRYAEKVLQLPEPDDSTAPVVSGAVAAKPRLKFTILKLSRRDAKEIGLREQLLHLDKGAASTKGPVAVAIFGRGRALPPLYGKMLATSYVDDILLFLTGNCSCQVKEMNPGVDLLMSTDWDTLLRGK